MSKKTILATSTSPFAHLLGGAAALAGRALGRKAEEDTPADEEGPTDEDDVIDGTEIDDVEDEPSEDEKAKGKKAKGKKAKADDEDADEDEDEPEAEEPDDEKEAKAFRAGRAAERKRCAAIFSSRAAAGRPDLAATLAFSTTQTSAEAIAVLSAANTPGLTPRGRLDDRMGNRTEARPGAGSGAGGGSPVSFGDQMAGALKKAGR